MRVVQVVSGYLPYDTGGTQIHLRDLCRGLRARGHEVDIFTRTGGDAHGELELSRDEWDGVPVTRLTNNFADLDRFELLYTHPEIDRRFDGFLAETRPDLVHVHHLTCLSTSMIEVARRRGLPVVMTLHDHWMVCLRGQRIRPDDLGICEDLDRARCLRCLQPLWPHLLPPAAPRRLLDRLLGRAPAGEKLEAWERHVRRMLEACTALTAPSRFHRDRFVEWGLDPSRIEVVPHGFEAAGKGVAPRPSRAPRHVGYVGSVIPSKGVHVLVEAFGRLDRRDLVLDVHGEAPSFHGDAGYLGRLEALGRPGLDVRFHGRYEHDELPAILAGLDVLVVPSIWWESFSLTAREGALAGLPVVASRLGALEEAIADGVATGFRAGDPDDLARVLREVLDDSAGRERARSAAARIAPLAETVARIEAIYRAAVATAAAGAPL